MSNIMLDGAVCRQRHELWPSEYYMKLSVDRHVNCDHQYVI